MDGRTKYDTAFWNSFILAVGATPHEVSFIQGSSGIKHRVVAAGIDASHRRLIIISFEPDARSAALMQADVQSVFRSIQVVVARPVPPSLFQFSKQISVEISERDNLQSRLAGKDKGAHASHAASDENLEELLQKFVSWVRQQPGSKLIPPELIEEWERRISSPLSKLLIEPCGDLENILQSVSLRETDGKEERDKPVSRIADLMALDPMEQDRKLGICSLPLDEFSPDDLELFQNDSNLKGIKNVLRNHHLLQYFYPPPDQIALGLIERGVFANIPQVVDQLVKIPDIGHPFGPVELIHPQSSFTEMIEELQEQQLVAKDQRGLVITEKGAAIRRLIRQKPREGLLDKILNRNSATNNYKASWLPVLRLQKG